MIKVMHLDDVFDARRGWLFIEMFFDSDLKNSIESPKVSLRVVRMYGLKIEVPGKTNK